MKVRILKPTLLRCLSLQPGDTIEVSALTPELTTLLDSVALDNQHHAELVRGKDVERTILPNHSERATTNGPRTTAVAR